MMKCFFYFLNLQSLILVLKSKDPEPSRRSQLCKANVMIGDPDLLQGASGDQVPSTFSYYDSILDK